MVNTHCVCGCRTVACCVQGDQNRCLLAQAWHLHGQLQSVFSTRMLLWIPLDQDTGIFETHVRALYKLSILCNSALTLVVAPCYTPIICLMYFMLWSAEGVSSALVQHVCGVSTKAWPGMTHQPLFHTYTLQCRLWPDPARLEPGILSSVALLQLNVWWKETPRCCGFPSLTQRWMVPGWPSQLRACCLEALRLHRSSAALRAEQGSSFLMPPHMSTRYR